jgi:chemotaxis protein MotB
MEAACTPRQEPHYMQGGRLRKGGRRPGLLVLPVLIGSGLMAGCADRDAEYRVSQSETSREKLQLALDTERAKVIALQRERDEARAETADLQKERALLEERIITADQRVDELSAMLHRQAVEPLGEPEVSGTALPADLDRSLTGLAERYKSKLSYDPARGAILLLSDRLFDSGSDEIRPDAHEAIGAVAAAASRFLPDTWEMIIVGHTDNASIVGEAVLAKHPSNWHLSVHRAIAVKDLLASAGLPQRRMGVLGYGPYRPISDDRDRNRRVEIYFVRTGEVRPLTSK